MHTTDYIRKGWRPWASLALVLTLLHTASDVGAEEMDVQQLMARVRAVDLEGKGHREAQAAVRVLSQLDVGHLESLLQGMDDAGDLASNWLRSTVESVAARAVATSQPLPIMALTTFVLDTDHAPRSRSLAYELIEQSHPEVASTLLRSCLDDASGFLRRRAVEQLMAMGREDHQAGRSDRALLVYRQALQHARAVDQIQFLSEALETGGYPVDLPRLLGFLTEWQVMGPFHNTGRAGYEAVFPPEAKVDLEQAYPGKEGTVRWEPLTTEDPYGMVDFNKPYPGLLKEVTAYATCVFTSETDRPAELRLGCKNGWKVWFNGEFLFGRDEYHRMREIDQYRLPVQLRKGENEILVKVCQNEQVEDWTVEWEFQLRVCDETGKAILSTDRP